MALDAPLDSASIPNTPEPANKSRQCASVITGASQLNRVSLIRSPVGRRPSALAKLSLRPRHLPPIIRSWLRDALFDEDVDLWGCFKAFFSS